MRLKDKVCFISGAGSGMGRQAALTFSREGAKVLLCDLNEDAGKETMGLVEKAGGKALFVRADVSVEQDVVSAFEKGHAAFGALHVLYNNAGIFPEKDHSVVDTDEAVWQKVYDVNTKGIYLACKHGIPKIIESGGGSVINIASFVALVGCSVPQDAYTASKGSVIALTKSLAVQFGPKRVRSNAICPGPILTPLLEDWLFKEPAEKEKRLSRIPMGRFGQTEDIVNLGLYLASDESSWTNGAVIPVDGGITANYF